MLHNKTFLLQTFYVEIYSLKCKPCNFRVAFLCLFCIDGKQIQHFTISASLYQEEISRELNRIGKIPVRDRDKLHRVDNIIYLGYFLRVKLYHLQCLSAVSHSVDFLDFQGNIHNFFFQKIVHSVLTENLPCPEISQHETLNHKTSTSLHTHVGTFWNIVKIS